MSGGRFGRQTLEKQQIEFRCLADKAGQQSMDLPTMVGLVIEPMRQGRSHLLLEFLRRGDAAVFDRSGDEVAKLWPMAAGRYQAAGVERESTQSRSHDPTAQPTR